MFALLIECLSTTSRINSLLERVAGPQTGEARHERARKLADEAEERYKAAVVVLDNLRLALEEALSEHYAYTQRCESDRLKAAASVLRSFHVAVAALPKIVSGSHERVAATLELISPSKDISAVIERRRTGPFQPRPIVYQSHYAESGPTYFGIDLRKFDETNQGDSKVPPVLTFMLSYLSKGYGSVSDPGKASSLPTRAQILSLHSLTEKRKTWLYETPLSAQHHLRSAINHSGAPLIDSALKPYDLPVIASTVKLWLLELEVPPILFTHYDEFKHLYPSRVGAETVDVPAKAIADHVSRLPPVHLEVSQPSPISNSEADK